ncbi:hypothetical protein Cylst_5228 [Cylindrospermum stagnale PCC 7417]|uniref:Uncharacterized protein n=1 Tax=Cylindrospermum stagnale PCC 7417 TaxID=56107 RepID=K9X6J5_9NOST|nr:hypothetical protein [Cylindrospermum stagnale]AFZ27262.1 hypothetical protein Cylst_5228 [Cylindrospermum stagnale PCC 7417]
MPKIPECDRCLFYCHNPHLVCAVHPGGVEGNNCMDFRKDPNADKEQWEPEGARYINDELVPNRSFYNGEEIIQPHGRWTPQEQLELIDWHPIFTGKCPQCGTAFNRDYVSRVHWDCECGWMDDTL